MHGNVYQWIEDCYETNIGLLPADGAAAKSGNCSVRCFRSNSFESNAKTTHRIAAATLEVIRQFKLDMSLPFPVQSCTCLTSCNFRPLSKASIPK